MIKREKVIKREKKRVRESVYKKTYVKDILLEPLLYKYWGLATSLNSLNCTLEKREINNTTKSEKCEY